MYGSVLSGGLAGHVHGTAAYDCTTSGEPKVPESRPYIWQALNYKSGQYMQHLKYFVLSEGKRYQDLLLASEDIHPPKAPDSPADGLDGWAYMMRTDDKDFALLYFENKAMRATLKNMKPDTAYRLTWFNPQSGKWSNPIQVTADESGNLNMPAFPGRTDPTRIDWAVKLLALKENEGKKAALKEQIMNMPRLSGQGRIQDEAYDQEVALVDLIVTYGKDSIPILADMIDDETEISTPDFSYWPQVTVGDVAFKLLTDLTTDYSRQQRTIPDTSFEDMIGQSNPDASFVSSYYDYVEKYGRQSIRDKWLRVSRTYGEQMYWDEKEKCFKIK